MDAAIKVEGLKAFRRDLKKIDENLAEQLRGDLLAVGQEIATEARSRVPLRTGRAAASIRAGVSGSTAYVAGGKKAVPYYGWLDFGSRNPVSGRPRSVGPWTRSGPGPQGGRFIYPTIKRNREDIKKAAEKAFEKAAEASLQETYD